MQRLLDLYTDYLLSSFGQVTATGLSKAVDGSISHDKITRMLSENHYTSKDLWKEVKSMVRKIENDSGCLIFDDSLLEKPYTDENEVVGWFFDHTENRSKKGINLLTAFYHCQPLDNELPLRIPVAFECVKKDISYIDSKTGKNKRKSSVTKNELMQQMIIQCIRNNTSLNFQHAILPNHKVSLYTFLNFMQLKSISKFAKILSAMILLRCNVFTSLIENDSLIAFRSFKK